MDYIVLDMEWNRAVDYTQIVKTPIFLTGEIIQIGAVKLNERFEMIDSFQRRVVPQHYTTLHPCVAEITKLTNADLQKGEPFCDVFDAFCRWCGNDFVFLIWGTEDLSVLRKNMELHDIDTSYMPACYNLQNIFAQQISKDFRQYGLEKALALVKETPFDAHDALNDAKSTALLCKHMDLSKGLAEYTRRVDHRNGCVESYDFEEHYVDIADALDDDYVVSFECPECSEIVWGENWVRKSGTILYALGHCTDGQKYLIKLKFRPVGEGRVVVRRFVYQLTDELLQEYDECVKQTELWRKYVIPAYAF